MKRLRDTTGSGTITMVLTLFAVLSVLAGCLVLTRASILAARASVAADLAALAASDTARGLTLADDPCALAQHTVAQHHAQLVECTVQDGGVVLIRTAIPAGFDTLGWTATAVARAGPNHH